MPCRRVLFSGRCFGDQFRRVIKRLRTFSNNVKFPPSALQRPLRADGKEIKYSAQLKIQAPVFLVTKAFVYIYIYICASCLPPDAATDPGCI